MSVWRTIRTLISIFQDGAMHIFDIDTPSLMLDVAVLDSNIRHAAELVRDNGKSLRPHTKTHKCVEVAKMQLTEGATGLTVAKLGEAETFSKYGFDDLFMANEVVGEAKLERLLALLRRVRLVIGVDSLEVAKPLAEAALRTGMVVPVRIDIDTGLGRAGVRKLETGLELARFIADHPGLELQGVFTHEGASYRSTEPERAANCAEAAEKVRSWARAISELCPLQSISAGSTPGLSYMACEAGITELRPGNYVFSDTMQVAFGAPLEGCALTVLATVISRPDADTAIIDAGTKTFASDKALEGSKHGAVLGHPEIVFDWASEEHGHLDLRQCNAKPAIGDKLRIVPFHACTCANMHEEYVVVRGEEVVDRWAVAARGKIK